MTKHWKSQRITLPGRSFLTRVSSLAIASGLVGMGLAFLSCEAWKAKDAFNSLQIVQVQSITSSGTDCVVSDSASDSARSSGTLDVYLPDESYPPYVLPLLIANNMDAVGETTATELNNITLTHFTVTLSAPGMTWSDACPATFDSNPFTVLLAPAAATGYAVEIIKHQHSQCLLAKLAPQPTDEAPRHILVTASVLAKGRHGGTTIESAPFVYTVDVCTGCLQNTYTDSSLVRYRYPAGFPACDALTGVNPYPGDSCLAPGQDAPILCCGLTDADGKLRKICPAIATGTATKTSTDTSTSTSTSTGH
jgi:hypothetical protein